MRNRRAFAFVLLAAYLIGCPPPGPEPPSEPAPGTIRTFAGIEFVWIPAGSFMMGSDRVTTPDEMPIHQVTITSGFWIGRFEVTQAQWQVYMGTNPSNGKGANRPVEQVSWEDCWNFIDVLNATNSGTYRLPSEAEWEYASRAGSNTEYCCTDDDMALLNYAWIDTNSGGETQDVGQKLPNAWGLHDTAGNVSEWCQDWYGEFYYSVSPLQNPTGPLAGDYKVYRGGSYFRGTNDVRSATRNRRNPDGSLSPQLDIGVRIVRNP